MIRTTKQDVGLYSNPSVRERRFALIERGEPIMVIDISSMQDGFGFKYARVLTRSGIGWVITMWLEDT